MTLELSPGSDLVFRGPFNAVSTTNLKLANSGTERLAYKIKTTAPKRYCVKPNSGFLDPQASTSIQVMLQPQPAGGQQDDRAKHKFMVQWIAVPQTWTDDVENFWKQDAHKLTNVQDSKLKCVFADEQVAVVPNDSFVQRDADTGSGYGEKISNAQPQQQTSRSIVEPIAADNTNRINNTELSPIHPRTTVGQQQQQQAQAQAHQQQNHQDGDDTNKQRTIDHLKEENANLRDRLKTEQQSIRQRNVGGGVDRVDNPVVHGRNQQQQSQKGLTILGFNLSEPMILIAFLIALVFGFTLGYYFFSCSN